MPQDIPKINFEDAGVNYGNNKLNSKWRADFSCTIYFSENQQLTCRISFYQPLVATQWV
jgi:hypothetical protein